MNFAIGAGIFLVYCKQKRTSEARQVGKLFHHLREGTFGGRFAMQDEVNFGLAHCITRGAKKKHPHRYFVVCVLNHCFAFIFALIAGGTPAVPANHLSARHNPSLNLNFPSAVSIFLGELMNPRPFFVTGDSAREYVAQAPQAFGS